MATFRAGLTIMVLILSSQAAFADESNSWTNDIASFGKHISKFFRQVNDDGSIRSGAGHPVPGRTVINLSNGNRLIYDEGNYQPLTWQSKVRQVFTGDVVWSASVVLTASNQISVVATIPDLDVPGYVHISTNIVLDLNEEDNMYASQLPVGATVQFSGNLDHNPESIKNTPEPHLYGVSCLYNEQTNSLLVIVRPSDVKLIRQLDPLSQKHTSMPNGSDKLIVSGGLATRSTNSELLNSTGLSQEDQANLSFQKMLNQLAASTNSPKVLSARSYTEADLAAVEYSRPYVAYGPPAWGTEKFKCKLANSCFVAFRVTAAVNMDTLAISSLCISDDTGKSYEPIAFSPDTTTGELPQQWFGVNANSKIVYSYSGGDRGGLILIMNPADRTKADVQLMYEVPLATKAIRFKF